MRRLALLAAVAVVVATACSSSDTASTTSTAAEQTATPEHIATAVAQHAPDLQDLIDRIGVCFTLTDPRCSSTTYGLDYFSLQLSAQALALGLQGVADPTAADYQGAVPDEVASLHEATLGAALDLDAAVQSFNDAGCIGPSGAECDQLNTFLHLRADALDSQIDAWAPYL